MVSTPQVGLPALLMYKIEDNVGLAAQDTAITSLHGIQLITGMILADTCQKLNVIKYLKYLKWENGLYIQFIQSFTKETISYDEHLKS